MLASMLTDKQQLKGTTGTEGGTGGVALKSGERSVIKGHFQRGRRFSPLF